MDDLWRLDAHELAAGVRTKLYSAREVVESILNRIAEKNPELNAITVEFPDEAMAAAEAADGAVSAGQAIGPLHGVPVTIKENIDVAGQATPNGVPAFANLIATSDSPLVRNLRSAGAILIGRTNVPEFSMRATTVNPLRGRTFNPWDAEASPGGSSGGGGAAAAAGLPAMSSAAAARSGARAAAARPGGGQSVERHDCALAALCRPRHDRV